MTAVAPGTFAIAPTESMAGALQRDYANTMAMIFGSPSSFDEILMSLDRIERALNGSPPTPPCR